MENKYLKLQEILKNEETCRRLFVLNAEECSNVLEKEYGLDFSKDELAEFMNGVKAALKDRENDELDEKDLEAVSGGRDSSSYGYGYSFGRFVPAAVVVGIAIATVW